MWNILFWLLLSNIKTGLSRCSLKLYFSNMTKIAFGSSSKSLKIKLEKFPYVQKPYLASTYIKSNSEEDIDMKNQ